MTRKIAAADRGATRPTAQPMQPGMEAAMADSEHNATTTADLTNAEVLDLNPRMMLQKCNN